MTIEPDLVLFEGYEPAAVDEALALSPDRRRTERQRQAIRAGSHPLGLALGAFLPLHPDAPTDAFDPSSPGARCGDCHFRVLAEHHSRTWPKCTAGVPESAITDSGGVRLDAAPRVSHGAGTDVRAWWPACRDHEPDVSSDQFRHRPADEPRPLP